MFPLAVMCESKDVLELISVNHVVPLAIEGVESTPKLK